MLALADGRIITGRQGVETKLIDAIGGEAEAIAWLEAERDIAADLPVITYYPLPAAGLRQHLGHHPRVGSAARLGFPSDGPIVLDGLVSLWQVQSSY